MKPQRLYIRGSNRVVVVFFSQFDNVFTSAEIAKFFQFLQFLVYLSNVRI